MQNDALPLHVIRLASKTFAGKKGFSGPEIMDFFRQYADDIPDYYGLSKVPSRWRLFEGCLKRFPAAKQRHILLDLCGWEGPMKWGRPEPNVIAKLRRLLLEGVPVDEFPRRVTERRAQAVQEEMWDVFIRWRQRTLFWTVLGVFTAIFVGFAIIPITGTLLEPYTVQLRLVGLAGVFTCFVIGVVALAVEPLRRFKHWGLTIYIISSACLAFAFMRYCFPVIVKPTCPGPTILRWMDSTGAVLDGNVLSPEKEVWLNEVYYGNIGPNHFEVYEVHDTVLDGVIIQAGGLPPITKFHAEKVDDCVKRSDHPWTLPPPSGFRGQSTFRFRDDTGNWSGEITATRLAKLHFEMPMEFEIEPAIYQVTRQATIEGEIVLASDPEVCMGLLVPWGEGEASLEDYSREYLNYLQGFNPDIRPDDFLDDFREYLPSEQPEGWELEVSPQVRVDDPSEPGPFTLRLTTPTLAKIFLAVRAIDCEDPSRFVVSEIIGIEGAPY